MKKTLITGARGFIGNKLGIYFAEKGYDVIGWDRISDNCQFRVKKVDMLDENIVLEALSVDRPDVIIHCAGSADVGKSVQNPTADYEGNVTITHNLLFSLHKAKLEKSRFVFLSSAGVYGNPISLPITEDMPLKPLSPYAVHKVMCEELCKYFMSNYGTNVKIARIFSAYGAGLKKQIFWDLYQKYKKNGRLDMYGTGNESRDYIHVDDVVQSIYLLASTENSGVVFNVANGEEVTIREVAELFVDSIGASYEDIFFNGIVREGDPLNWKADITKIKALGYNKTVNMRDGLHKYAEWCIERAK